MFWIIKSVIITIVLIILSCFLLPNYHIGIGNDLFYASFIFSVVCMFINNLLFKYFMPNLYQKYKTWYDQSSLYIKRIVILPLFGYCIFFMSFLSYINQHNVIAPIETIKTKVINKYKKREAYYTKIYFSSGKALEINNENLYNVVDIGDDVIIKFQKGRLREYFAIELKIEKNNYIISL